MYIGLDLINVNLTTNSFHDFLMLNSKVLERANPEELKKLAEDMEYLARCLKEDFRVRRRAD